MMLLSGCAAMQTALEHKDLEASSQLSKTVFLDEQPDYKKLVYVNIKNTNT